MARTPRAHLKHYADDLNIRTVRDLLCAEDAGTVRYSHAAATWDRIPDGAPHPVRHDGPAGVGWVVRMRPGHRVYWLVNDPTHTHTLVFHRIRALDGEEWEVNFEHKHIRDTGHDFPWKFDCPRATYRRFRKTFALRLDQDTTLEMDGVEARKYHRAREAYMLRFCDYLG